MLFSVCLYAEDGLFLTKVVIDAGHGGSDPGCVSADGRTTEKTITLDISKRLAGKIRDRFPSVSVVLTRSNDSFVSLDQRAQIANKCDANLFVSIHVNACPQTSANGFSVHVMGQSNNKNRDLYAYNMNVCQRENSVIELEDDYTTKYQGFDPSNPESFIFMTLMQNAYLEQSLLFAQMVSDNLSGGPVKRGRGIWQDPFYVLWKTAMPAVLVETGFMSNSTDLAALRDPDNREIIADRLLRAFEDFKAQYDQCVNVSEPQPDAAPVPEAVKQQPSKVYGVQILALSRRLAATDPLLLGYEPRVIQSGSINKYVIAVSEDKASVRAALAGIRRKYPDSFMVSIEGETLKIEE